MTSRSLLLAAAFTVAIASPLLNVPLMAQDQPQPEVENSKFNFAGVINANSVYVRSGPSENYYPTIKLDKGAPVTVVGIKFDWLKIVPPDGSFCYVAKVYVEKHGDGSKGRVTKPDLNVRAGSTLNAMKTAIQTKLNENDDVEIVGEQDEYFKIKPPSGAYLYVNKQFVDPGKPVVAGATPAPDVKPDVPAAIVSGDLKTSTTPDAAPVAPAPTTPVVITTPDATIAKTSTAAPTATDAGANTTTAVAAAPTTQTSDVAPTTQQASAEEQFDKAEASFMQLSSKPIDEQPVADLLASYQELAKNAQLAESMHRIVDYRIATLKVRSDARDQLVALKKTQEEAAQKRLAMKAEQQEIQDRMKSNDIVIYTAVGTLRTSSLQEGAQLLYRLTDPGTGRTVAYVRTNDSKYASLLGQFIGVKGSLATDPQLSLKVVTPTDAEQIDPNKVSTNITAQIIPPTLAAKHAEASTN